MKKYLFIVLLVGFGFGQVFSKEKLEFDEIYSKVMLQNIMKRFTSNRDFWARNI